VVKKMKELLIFTLLILPLLGIFKSLGRLFGDIGKGISRMFKPPTPKEVLQMRQKSGGLSEEGWELLGQFKEQYGTPLQLVAPVLSEIERRIFLANELRNISRNLNNLLSPSALASRRLATLEQTGAMEQELQRQAQALGASGMRSGSLARALMGARMGTMMERARMMADANLQEQMLRQQIMEQQYQLKEREQMIREQMERDRFRLLMGLRSAFEEQAVKGGAMTMENIFQAEQLATQQMAGLMQGIGALGSAYAQYRQNQEMLRAMQQQQQQQQFQNMRRPIT
jgi:hypothetical protein